MRRLATVVVALTAMAGCGDTVNNYGSDGGTGTGDAAGTCTPNTKECVTDRVARICAADGSGWVSQQCDFGDICTGGDCMLDPNVACTPGDGICADATHALLCNSNGMGFSTRACPANTQCAGPGVCVGTCIVGESICLDSFTVATCMDGQKLTTTSCTVGTTACVSTGTTPFQTAACKPAQCIPGPTGCNSVCGDKSASSSNTDPGFESFCQETPDGFKWVALQCPAGGSCNPNAIVCGGGVYAASCTTECSPGQARCNGAGSGVQTCGSNGHWGATTACTPDATGAQQVCIQNFLGTDQAKCGDAVCGTGFPGACEADGFHACVNGKVAATATACSSGTCIPMGPAVNGFTPGQCGAQCQTGEQRCATANASQACVNGLWGSTLTACASGTCQEFTDATTGLAKTVCGVCQPGTHRCTNSGGTPASPSTHIETCNATGQWGAAAACVVGLCRSPGGLNTTGDAACIAECIPNSQICVGGAKGGAAANPQHPGTIAVGTCSATGILPPTPGCPAGTGCCPGTTSCRNGPSGKPVQSTNTPAACVDCVGPSITGGNEAGLVDTRCTSGTALQTCQANNTWSADVTCTTCTPESGAIGVETCAQINGSPISDSFFNALGGPTLDCAGVFGNPSAPCGGVADCCIDTCNPAPAAPTPGFCQ